MLVKASAIKFLVKIGIALSFLCMPSMASAQLPGVPAWNSDCYYDHKGDSVLTIRGFECIFARFIAIAISIIGIIVLIMIVMGAYNMLFSGGDPKGVETAKNTITYAVLGIILAISSWFIIRTVARLTGSDGSTNPDFNITIFKINAEP